VKLILTCYRELLVRDVIKIFWALFVFCTEAYIYMFKADNCLICINIAVQLNHLMLSNSYRSLQSDIYCIMKLHLRTIHVHLNCLSFLCTVFQCDK